MKKVLTTVFMIILAFPCMLVFNIGIICTELENIANGFNPEYPGERKQK